MVDAPGELHRQRDAVVKLRQHLDCDEPIEPRRLELDTANYCVARDRHDQ